MIKYLKMKKMEHELKYTLYSTIATFMNEQKDILALIQNLYVALKDVSATELRSELISKMAELIHEDNMK